MDKSARWRCSARWTPSSPAACPQPSSSAGSTTSPGRRSSSPARRPVRPRTPSSPTSRRCRICVHLALFLFCSVLPKKRVLPRTCPRFAPLFRASNWTCVCSSFGAVVGLTLRPAKGCVAPACVPLLLFSVWPCGDSLGEGAPACRDVNFSAPSEPLRCYHADADTDAGAHADARGSTGTGKDRGTGRGAECACPDVVWSSGINITNSAGVVVRGVAVDYHPRALPPARCKPGPVPAPWPPPGSAIATAQFNSGRQFTYVEIFLISLAHRHVEHPHGGASYVQASKRIQKIELTTPHELLNGSRKVPSVQFERCGDRGPQHPVRTVHGRHVLPRRRRYAKLCPSAARAALLHRL